MVDSPTTSSKEVKSPLPTILPRLFNFTFYLLQMLWILSSSRMAVFDTPHRKVAELFDIDGIQHIDRLVSFLDINAIEQMSRNFERRLAVCHQQQLGPTRTCKRNETISLNISLTTTYSQWIDDAKLAMQK